MGLNEDGTVNTQDRPRKIPDFGAASDGDADRNMILGKNFFVTPSDSVAVIAAQSKCIPFFAKAGGLKSVARSMPTSGALDRVAEEMKIPMFEVPTGWKFFGNLMDSKAVYGKSECNPLICGEESFGTGSNHVREKDGLWAVLAWMSILAEHNKDDSQPLVPISVIVTRHWEKFGRNYYRRYDYEGVATEGANQLMDAMRAKRAEVQNIPRLKTGAACKSIDDFAYLDPVDGSVSKKQGIRVLYEDGSRFVFRLSGTGSVGATIRLYMEQYMNPEQVAGHLKRSGATYHGTLPDPSDVLEDLSNISLQTSQMEALTGRTEPTVIT
jgi:phosphoglucomutase